MIKDIKKLALEVQELAHSKGFTSIEPSPDILTVNFNKEGVHTLDFTLRKGNSFAGRSTVFVKNASVSSQTVEQVSNIQFI